jgi:cytochrome c556
MKRRRVLLFAVAAAAGLWAAVGQSQEPKKNPDSIMRKKLEHTQKVLEGIAVKDFDLIEKHADNLMILSQKAEWKVLPTPEYALRSDEFRRNADSLARAAKDKNLDGAALAYVEMTMSCVKCHKHVREVRMTRLD